MSGESRRGIRNDIRGEIGKGPGDSVRVAVEAIEEAKRPETRARRIAEALDMLRRPDIVVPPRERDAPRGGVGSAGAPTSRR